jgi:AcrR family transcriptional regulator
MIWSAALLMRKQGVDATSFSDVVVHSGAPRGSIYHYFPGGKAELIEEATRYAGDFTAAGLAAALAGGDPATAIGAFVADWARILRRSEFAAGCPVVAASLDGDRAPRARDAAAAAFRHWEDVITEALEPHLNDAERSRAIATLVIAAIEGAVVLARAQRTAAPLERVSVELERLLSAAIGELVG